MYGILPPQTQNTKTTTKTVGQNITKKTLDVQHNIKMQQFIEKEEHEKKLSDQINKFKNELDNLYEKRKSLQQDDELNDIDINRIID